MEGLSVAFDAIPVARWGPLFHVLLLERPDLSLEWRPLGFPTAGGSLLRGADVGLFVQPPHEPGIESLVVETSELVVAMAAGHRLGRANELSIGDVLDETFLGGRNLHREWLAFWTLDAYRGGPPRVTDDEVENAAQGIEVVVSGRAIATVPAALVDGFAHPGLVAVPLADGPRVETRLVWRSGDANAAVQSLIALAQDMTRTDA
jgi:DNA-binding transcriptional LysR family regulator